jgi:hypothetical protein
MTVQMRRLQCQPVGVADVVRVHAGDVPAARCGKSGVKGGHNAAMAHMQYPHALILRGQTVQNPGRAVCGTVIHGQQLKAVKLLAQHAVHRCFQSAGALTQQARRIVYGHENGDRRRGV